MEHKVVKTRAERAIIAQQIQNQVQNDKLAEIRQKAKNLAEIRQKDINLAARRSKNQLENPGKTSASTKKRKARKDSLKFERLLAKKKKNLSKVRIFLIKFENFFNIFDFFINRLPIAICQIFRCNLKAFFIKFMIQSRAEKPRKNSNPL